MTETGRVVACSCSSPQLSRGRVKGREEESECNWEKNEREQTKRERSYLLFFFFFFSLFPFLFFENRKNAMASSSLPRRKAKRDHAKAESVVEIKCPPERHVSTPFWELVEHAKGVCLIESF